MKITIVWAVSVLGLGAKFARPKLEHLSTQVMSSPQSVSEGHYALPIHM